MIRAKMSLWQRRLLWTMAGLGAIGYFSFHAFHGNYGIFARERLRAEVADLSSTLASVKAERKAIEHRVALLTSQSLDPDLLEERVRDTLNFTHPNDVLIVERTSGAPAR